MTCENLLDETIQCLTKIGKTVSDVKWVGSADGKYAISWPEFEKIANTEYDNGYGSSKVSEDLVIVFSDGWLSRHEYDGAEWWVFNTKPVKSDKPLSFENVTTNQYNAKGGFVVGWESIASLNGGESE